MSAPPWKHQMPTVSSSEHPAALKAADESAAMSAAATTCSPLYLPR
jgi:hypothetical protein